MIHMSLSLNVHYFSAVLHELFVLFCFLSGSRVPIIAQIHFIISHELYFICFG